MKKAQRACALLLALLWIPAAGMAASIRDMLMGIAESDAAYTAELSAGLNVCMPYDENRLEDLNALMKHLQLQIAHDGALSVLRLEVDGTEALRMTAKTTEGESLIHFSFDEERNWKSSASLRERFIPLPELPGWEELNQRNLGALLSPEWIRLPEDAAELLRKLPEMYGEQAKTNAIRTKIKEFGTATQKTVITLTKADTEAGRMDRLAEETDNAILRSALKGFAYSGRQQFTLYTDENGQALRFLYSGQAGREGDARKVSLDWKMKRDGVLRVDEVTFKAPGVKGTNKDTVTFTREEDEAALNLQLSWKRTKNKKKAALEGQLQLGTDEDGRLTGALEGSFGTDPATRINIRIEPDIQYSEPANWQGTLLVRQTEGDAPRLEMKLQARMEPGAAISFPDGKRTYTLQSAESLPADLDTKMAAALIKPLLALPQEDLRFLLDELDETQMERIREAANPTAEGGNTP